MTRDDTLWLAGLLEGEGCFDVHHYKKQGKPSAARVRLSMTDADVVQRVADLWGRAVNVSHLSRKNVRWNDAYTTTITGRPAEAIMRAVRPYMGRRRGERIDSILTEVEREYTCNLAA